MRVPPAWGGVWRGRGAVPQTALLVHLLQVFKFIYSCRLAEMGLATQAFHYCEVIAKTILMQPHAHSPVLISQLAQVTSPERPPGDTGLTGLGNRAGTVGALGTSFLNGFSDFRVLGRASGVFALASELISSLTPVQKRDGSF